MSHNTWMITNIHLNYSKYGTSSDHHQINIYGKRDDDSQEMFDYLNKKIPFFLLFLCFNPSGDYFLSSLFPFHHYYGDDDSS